MAEVKQKWFAKRVPEPVEKSGLGVDYCRLHRLHLSLNALLSRVGVQNNARYLRYDSSNRDWSEQERY